MKLLISMNIKNDEDGNFKGFHIYETNIQFRFHSISTTVNLVIATSHLFSPDKQSFIRVCSSSNSF